MTRISAPVRIASDAHPDLILLWKALQDGWTPPISVTEEEYKALRKSSPSPLRGFVGFGLSYSGKWFGGYARDNRGVNYAVESGRSIERKRKNIEGVQFLNVPYQEVDVSWVLGQGKTLVYCDPPYSKTTSHFAPGQFNSEEFWGWVRRLSQQAKVFVSEYDAPPDFQVAWQKNVKTCLRGGSKEQCGPSGIGLDRVEKLFSYPTTGEVTYVDPRTEAYEEGLGDDSEERHRGR